MSKKIFWAILPERCVYDVGFEMGLRVAYEAGRKGYTPIYAQYGRTDVTRQALALAFLEMSKEPEDTLVMLDVDMDHPAGVIERLAAHGVPVVAALAFRRGEPYQACAFRRGADGQLRHLASFPPGLHEMHALGTGAIAIQRRVFETLVAKGLGPWFFKYEYDGALSSPSEDMFFSGLCERAGITMYVDTALEVPHITYGFIDRATHEAFMVDHPDALRGTLTAPLPSDEE